MILSLDILTGESAMGGAGGDGGDGGDGGKGGQGGEACCLGNGGAGGAGGSGGDGGQGGLGGDAFGGAIDVSQGSLTLAGSSNSGDQATAGTGGEGGQDGEAGAGGSGGTSDPTGSGTGGADGQSGKDGAAGLPGSSVTDGTASNPEIAGVYDNETVKLAVSSLPPSSIGVSVPFALSVELQYGTGAVDTGFDGMVTLKLSSNPGGATLGGTLTETASDGVAVFSGLSINRAASGYAIEASTISNPSTNSTITSAPVGIDVTQTPTPTPKPTTPAINWANPAGITYGTPLSSTQLDASASVHGTFTYSRPPGTVLKAGSDTLSVTFMPTDTTDYLTVSKTVTIVVAQATPVIIWSPPAAIASGTALSSAQLDASASVPGTFSYSPAPGTVLGAGSETLSVTFTPSDSTDYKTVSATMPLTILPAPTPPPTSTPSPTPTPAPAVVISQQPVFQRKTNKKGKPVGKAALSGVYARLRLAARSLGRDRCRQLPGGLRHHQEGQEEGRAHPPPDHELHGLVQRRRVTRSRSRSGVRRPSRPAGRSRSWAA